MTDYKDYNFESHSPSHTINYLTDKILSVLDSNKNRKILDVGCGNGWLSRILIEKGFDVYGIDASKSGIAIARSFHPERYLIQDISSSELPKEISHVQFDTIISTEVIEHLYSPRNYISFCKNILLKSEGELIITTPYHGYFKNLLLAVTGKLDDHFTVNWEGGHIKFFSKNTITELLNREGFIVEKFIGCGRLPFLWKSMLIKSSINVK